LLLGAFDPAVALRYTAGYAHLAPCEAKREKQNKTPNPVESENSHTRLFVFIP
jgi:hypothetical protein